MAEGRRMGRVERIQRYLSLQRLAVIAGELVKKLAKRPVQRAGSGRQRRFGPVY